MDTVIAFHISTSLGNMRHLSSEAVGRSPYTIHQQFISKRKKGSKRVGPSVIKVSPNASSFLLVLEHLFPGSRAHLLELTCFPLLVPQTGGRRRGEEIREQRRKQKNEKKPTSFWKKSINLLSVEVTHLQYLLLAQVRLDITMLQLC